MYLVFRVHGEIKTRMLSVLFRTWGSAALQLLAAEISVTTTNMSLSGLSQTKTTKVT